MADYKLSMLVETKDKATAPIKNVLKQANMLKRMQNIKTTITAKDNASSVMRKLKTDANTAKWAVQQVGATLKSVTGKGAHWITLKAKDGASATLGMLKSKLAALARGVTIVATAKMVIEGIGAEQTQKITINRVFENTGLSKSQAKKQTEQYYSYLEEYANKTPFSTRSVAQFGTKAAMIAKGDMGQAKEITGLMGNVKAFVGDMRTEEEVAEAFFSASNGNMEMLNNMLGTQYKTFDEARKGIAKNQGGLVDEMSKTLPGAISTLQGVMQVGLKNMFMPFSTGMASGINKLTQAFEVVAPMIGGVVQQIAVALAPVGDLFNQFLDSIINKSPATMNIFNLLGTVIVTVFQMIGAVVRAVSPVITQILTFIGEYIVPVIISAVQLLGSVWQSAWEIIKAALDVAWKIIQPALSSFSDLLDGIKDTIDAVRNAWEKAWDFIKSNPITGVINTVTKGSSKPTGSAGPKFAVGSPRIPKDDYPARLHKGEKVLNRREADEYDKGSKGIIIPKLADTIVVREEADIDKIMYSLNRNLRKALAGGV